MDQPIIFLTKLYQLNNSEIGCDTKLLLNKLKKRGDKKMTELKELIKEYFEDWIECSICNYMVKKNLMSDICCEQCKEEKIIGNKIKTNIV